jgi:hypothetical protein
LTVVIVNGDIVVVIVGSGFEHTVTKNLCFLTRETGQEMNVLVCTDKL